MDMLEPDLRKEEREWADYTNCPIVPGIKPGFPRNCMKVYLNGQWVEEQDARISFDDRGFLFGDGVYEVVHIYSHRFFEWNRHMVRLRRSLKAIDLPGIDLEAIGRAGEQLLESFDGQEGALYLEITRGAHPRSHPFPSADVLPTILMWIRPIAPLDPQWIEKGVSVITVADDRWAKVWIKTICLLPNVLAKEKAHKMGMFDAIFVRDGMVTESTSANVFIIYQGRLQTAPVSNYILPGITREVILEIAHENGIPVVLEPFSVDDMLNASEVFLTGTTTEVLPVTQVNGQVIGQEAGAVSRLLLRELKKRANTVS